jgi:hypothetical protein
MQLISLLRHREIEASEGIWILNPNFGKSIYASGLNPTLDAHDWRRQ